MPIKTPFLYQSLAKEFPSVFSARRKNLRSSIIKLKANKVCLFSPVKGLNDKLLASIKELGDPSFILAPNHYHHAAIVEYAEQFPQAVLCAPDFSIPRLNKVTGLEFSNLDSLLKQLPKNVSVLSPKGLKTGEIWLKVIDDKKTAWLVVDAFSGPASPDSTLYESKAELLKTFPRYGVNNLEQYQAWVDQQLLSDSPQLLVPCHGAPVYSDSLVDQLQKVMDTGFK